MAAAGGVVLVPLDGSAFAEHALPYAAAIARAMRARVRLVLAHQLPRRPPARRAASCTPGWRSPFASPSAATSARSRRGCGSSTACR